MSGSAPTRLLRNVGNERVIDFLRAAVARGAQVRISTSGISLYSLAELLPNLEAAASVSVIVPADEVTPTQLTSHPQDRGMRNTLRGRFVARRTLSWLRRDVEVPGRLAWGRDAADVAACAAFDRSTLEVEDLSFFTGALARAVASIVGRGEERAVERPFRRRGTHALEGEFPGVDDFEVVTWMALMAEPRRAAAGVA